MSRSTNPYCEVLGIEPPRVEAVKDDPLGSFFVFLIVAVLERGEPMTLEEAAERFERAGIAPADEALRRLKRCRPGRPPLYREGDRYGLDPYHREMEKWVSLLGLRPPDPPVPKPRPREFPPLPGPDEPLRPEELDEAFEDMPLYGPWSVQRLALAVLEAHGSPLAPERVVELLERRTRFHGVRPEHPHFRRPDALVRELPDGRWAIAPGAEAGLRKVREMVRELIGRKRERARYEPDPGYIEAWRARWEKRRRERAAELAALRRVIVRGLPERSPRVFGLLDVAERTIQTYAGPDAAARVRQALEGYDWVLGLDVRALLRQLGVAGGLRRVADLAPGQKSIRMAPGGRPLRVTVEWAIRSSCNIRQPFGRPESVRRWARAGDDTRLRRRVAQDLKALYALHQYGRAHHGVRLLWRDWEAFVPAPWVYREEPSIHEVMQRAWETGELLDVVAGKAPDWDDPWSGALACRVVERRGSHELWFQTLDGRFMVPPAEAQAVRPLGGGSWSFP